MKMQARVDLKFPDDLKDLLGPINDAIDENCAKIARQIASDARGTSAFADKTGTLRKSIKARKSKFEDGGYIVLADAPHAHLVEYGHALVRGGKATGKGNKGGKSIGHVPAHPFLRPAKEKAIAAAIAAFKEAFGQ